MSLRFLTTLVLLIFIQNAAIAQTSWDKEAARDYLDSRASKWTEWNSSHRDSGATRCVSCHTGLNYGLARQPLAKALGEENTNVNLRNLLENVKRRATDPNRQLYYEFNNLKKSQSKGTEAVINSLILSIRDNQSASETMADETKAAFAELWETQVPMDQLHGGSFRWLDFRLEPWESGGARYYGAALAAIALGHTPDHYRQSDSIADSKSNLFSYLKLNFDEANAHGKIYAYWAHLVCDDVLSDAQVSALFNELQEKRSESTGGWAIADFIKSDTDRDDDEIGNALSVDGYATGLITYVLLKSHDVETGIDTTKALKWLKQSQLDDGSWPASSVNKTRDPDSHTGKFMRDAATAFAVMALLESEN